MIYRRDYDLEIGPVDVIGRLRLGRFTGITLFALIGSLNEGGYCPSIDKGF